MYCQQCGRELPAGALTCPGCGSRVYRPWFSLSSDLSFDLDQAVADAKAAAKDLASITARISQRVAASAERAAKDPSGSAKRGARRVVDELDKARHEIEKILSEL
jgi:predicted  nucleic acid-binding Zn-ribbon protein